MSTKKKLDSLSIVLILVMLASWVLNFGWVRIVLTWVLAPFVHAVLFFIGNRLSAKNIATDQTVRCVTILSCITFLIADGGDIGGAYCFFHLIEGGTVVEVCTKIGVVMLVMHIVLLLMQYILYFRSFKTGGV